MLTLELSRQKTHQTILAQSILPILYAYVIHRVHRILHKAKKHGDHRKEATNWTEDISKKSSTSSARPCRGGSLRETNEHAMEMKMDMETEWSGMEAMNEMERNRNE